MLSTFPRELWSESLQSKGKSVFLLTQGHKRCPTSEWMAEQPRLRADKVNTENHVPSPPFTSERIVLFPDVVRPLVLLKHIVNNVTSQFFVDLLCTFLVWAWDRRVVLAVCRLARAGTISTLDVHCAVIGESCNSWAAIWDLSSSFPLSRNWGVTLTNYGFRTGTKDDQDRVASRELAQGGANREEVKTT